MKERRSESSIKGSSKTDIRDKNSLFEHGLSRIGLTGIIPSIGNLKRYLMSPVSYIELARKAFPDQPPYQWSAFQDAPFTPMKKALKESRMGLVSSCGVYQKDQPPFDPNKNDLTFREIPTTVDAETLRIAHDFYDRTDARQDVNCVFPVERFRELVAEGFIGTFVSPAYSFMGRIFMRRELQGQLIPALIQKFMESKLDGLFLVPC